MRKIIISKDFFIQEYLHNKKSIAKIAKELGCSITPICRSLKKHNIKTRTTSEGNIKHGKYVKGVFCCVEPNCNNRVCQKFRRCRFCAQKGRTFTIKTRNKMSKIAKKRLENPENHPMFKKHQTEESKNKIKNSEYHKNLKGQNHPFYGRKHKKESKQQQSLSHGGTGISYENAFYPLEFDSKLKYEIRQRDNFECSICDFTEEEHIIIYGIVLAIHHIDYNKKNCKKENLITLCKQCNTRVNFNRNYWENYFEKKIDEKKKYLARFK